METTIKIGIAEDQEIMREGLAELIAGITDIQIAFSAGNGKELLDALNMNLPDIVLLDLKMPVMSGRVALEKMRLKYKDLKVIILSNFASDEQALKYIKLGACAFIDKNCTLENLLDAVKTVYETGYYFDERTTSMLAKNVHHISNALPVKYYPDDLSEREISIIKLMCQNRSTEEMASVIGISASTIEYYQASINEKLGLYNISEISSYALQNNIIKYSHTIN